MGYLPDRLVSLRPEKRQPLISGHKLPPLPSVAMDQDCKSTTSLDITILTLSSVVFQWSISYMISPDAANLGLKAIYIWAGLLVPTTVLLYLYYPEVCPDCTVRILLTCRRVRQQEPCPPTLWSLIEGWKSHILGALAVSYPCLGLNGSG
jgi:hypothetical protein